MTVDEAEREYARGREAVDRVIRRADDVTLDDFQYWLFYMDDDLQAFMDRLSPDVRQKLDYSVESLDALEGWLLRRYQEPGELQRESELVIWDGAGRYIGETIRRNVGGKWRIVLDDPSHVFYRMPQLYDFGPKSTPQCPNYMATAALDRRTGTFIRGVVENMKRRYGSST